MRELLFIPTVHDQKDSIIPEDFKLEEQMFKKLDRARNWVWSRIYAGLKMKDQKLSGTKAFAEGMNKDTAPYPDPVPLGIALAVGLKGFQKGLFGRDTMLRHVFYLAGAEFVDMENSPLLGKRKEAEVANIESIAKAKNAIDALIESENWSKQDKINAVLAVGKIALGSLRLQRSLLSVAHDRHYGSVINENLKRQGILRVGFHHNVLRWLDPDINVTFVDPELEAVWKYTHKGLIKKTFGDPELEKAMLRIPSFRQMGTPQT